MQIPKVLNLKNVLSALHKKGYDEYSLFSYYCTNFKAINKDFVSEFRSEKKPSSRISYINGNLLFKDFGSTDSAINIWKYIEKKFGYSGEDTFKKVLSRVILDFHLEGIEIYSSMEKVSNSPSISLKKGILTTLPTTPKINELKSRKREWFSWDIDEEFWLKPYSITKEELLPLLNEYNVQALEYYWVNDWQFKVSKDNPVYSYCLGDKKKFYSPYDKKFKWTSNVPKSEIFGLKQLPESGDLLLIESSLKDTIYNRLLGFYSLPLNGEAMFMPVEFFNMLKSKWKKILYHVNNDFAGIKAGYDFKVKYGLDFVTNPGIFELNKAIYPKDTTDYWKCYGRDKTKIMLNNIIKI